MRALVTGGAGFIGSHLADALVAAGHEVTVLDDLSRGRRDQVPAAAHFVEADVNDELNGVFAACRPDDRFHQAAQIDVRRSVADPLLDTRVNVLGTVNAPPGLRCRAASGAWSSPAAGARSTATPTRSRPRRDTPAAGVELRRRQGRGGAVRRRLRRVCGLEFVALRYANVYGPRQDPHGEAGVVAIFAERMLRGEVPTINGDGTQTRDYVYVGDVVAANLLATAAPPGAYNVGTGTECDVNDLHRRLARIIGVDRRAGPRPGQARGAAPFLPRPVAGGRPAGVARRASPWIPACEATVAYFRERGSGYL